MTSCQSPDLLPDVPLTDLAAQHRALSDEIGAAIWGVIANSSFILGPAVADFEARFAATVGVRHCVGVASGTDALMLAARALDLGPGDEVITTPTTWISTAFAASHLGARPVFVDIAPATLQMDAGAVRRALTPKTRAVFAVHLYGHPAPLHQIAPLCRERGIALVEDVAQAPQAAIEGRTVGTFGDLACYSFYPSKNLGCMGDGGAVVTDRADLAERVRRYARYGQRASHEHLEIGWNSRLDTVQAAILLAKLPHLARWNQQRRACAARYRQLLAGLPVEIAAEAPWARSVHHLFPIQVAERNRCLAFLRDRGVMAQVHYPTLVPFQPCYRALGYRPGDLPVAERMCARLLSLPLYPELTDDQQDRVVDALKAFFATG